VPAEPEPDLRLFIVQSETQRKITDTEKKLDASEILSSELATLTGEIKERKTLLEKVKNDIQSSEYESKLTEKNSNARNLEDRRDQLNRELHSVSLQADSMARLDLKRTELRTKTADVKNTCVVSRFLAIPYV